MSYDVLIYTDGSASTVDRSGGWAAMLIAEGKEGPRTKVVTGWDSDTTNQRMELKAAIGGLAALRRRRRLKVKVYSDSAYLVNCFVQGWISKWRAEGWRTYRNTAVANRDLWATLDRYVAIFDVEFEHVKGHAGHVLNEQVDRLASEARRQGIAKANSAKPKQPATSS